MAESGRHNNRGWLAAQRFTDEKRPTVGGQMVQTKEDPDRPLGLCDANHKNKGKPDTILWNNEYQIVNELSVKQLWLVYYTLVFLVGKTKATRKGDRLTARDGWKRDFLRSTKSLILYPFRKYFLLKKDWLDLKKTLTDKHQA